MLNATLLFKSLMICLLLLIVPVEVLSAQVCLKNGDCLHGEIVVQTETTVTVQHPNLGLLTLPLTETDKRSAQTETDRVLTGAVKDVAES